MIQRTIKFRSLDRLLKAAEADGVFFASVRRARKCQNLQESLETAKTWDRIRFVTHGFLQYLKHLPWDCLDSKDWMDLISAYPQLLKPTPPGRPELTDLHLRLNGFIKDRAFYLEPADRVTLLKQHPHLSKPLMRQVRGQYSGFQWIEILEVSPKLVSRIPKSDFKQFQAYPIVSLITKFPQLTKYVPWERFTGYEWVTVLSVNPSLVEHMEYWDKLTKRDWVALQRLSPQFTKYRPTFNPLTPT